MFYIYPTEDEPMNPYSRLSVKRLEKIMSGQSDYDNPGDLIADIMHWCDHTGQSFEELLDTAQGYYDADREEEHDLEHDDGA